MNDNKINAKGLMAVRAARACALSKSHGGDAIEMTRRNDPQVSAYLEKSLVSGVGLDGMPSLSGDVIAREFGEYIFAQSVPGKLLAKAMQVPFGSPVASISGLGSAWVKEGEAVPLTGGNVTSDKLYPFKVASIAVVSNELLRSVATGSSITIRNAITSEAVRTLDSRFLSQDAEVAGLSPAGALCNADSAQDYAALLEKHTSNGNSLATSALILPSVQVLTLTDAQFKQFELLGIELISSQYATQTALIDAARLIINVQGTIIDTSAEGSVEMDSAPGSNINDPKGTTQVSLFQDNASALRAVTYCSWAATGKSVTLLAS